MRKFLFALFVVCSFVMNAQVVQVSGNQSGVWNGEVHLTGDVFVPDGEVLTVEAGTSVIADGYYGITVSGAFLALGDKESRISFTVADTTGYSNYAVPELGGWKGILFFKPDEIKIDYCDFSYGKTQLDGDGGAMCMFWGRDVEISNSTFHHNTMRRRGGAIFAENSILNIHDCTVYDNFGVGFEGSYTWGSGFQFLKCNIVMSDMVFYNNTGAGYGGGMNVDSCNLELKNAVFYKNSATNAGGLGIQRCKNYNVKVSNMLAYENSVIHYGGGLAIATSDPELNNLTIVHNYCGGGGGAGMQNAFNANPTLNNCIFYDNRALHISKDDNRDTVEYYYGSQIWLWGSDCFPIFNNGLVQYGLDTIGNGEFLPESHYNDMINTNPLFVNASMHDYHLTENSPCVNTGTADISGLFVPYIDLDGGPRICGERIDMGCYEFCYENVNETSIDENIISIYPNPLNDNAYCIIKLNKNSDVVLRLFSLDGKEVYREEIKGLEAGENHVSLDGMMGNLEKSNKIYLLNVDNQSVKIIY